MRMVNLLAWKSILPNVDFEGFWKNEKKNWFQIQQFRKQKAPYETFAWLELEFGTIMFVRRVSRILFGQRIFP